MHDCAGPMWSGLSGVRGHLLLILVFPSADPRISGLGGLGVTAVPERALRAIGRNRMATNCQDCTFHGDTHQRSLIDR